MNDQLGKGHGNFIPQSVRIIDYDKNNNNILVRGSSLVGTAGFKITQLTKAIKADKNYPELKKAGIKIEANPMIIDFCLIGFVQGHKDERIVKAEVKWFTSVPQSLNGNSGPYPTYIASAISNHPGVMVYWPIQAIGGTAPTQAGGTWPVSPANSIGSGTGQFNYSGLIPAISNALHNSVSSLPAGFPVSSIENAIIYVHCDSGVNRTGAAIAGYLLTYGSNLKALSLPRIKTNSYYTLAKAQTAANSAPPGNDTNPPGGCDIPVAEAYCNFLNTDNLDAPLVAHCVPLSQ